MKIKRKNRNLNKNRFVLVIILKLLLTEINTILDFFIKALDFSLFVIRFLYSAI